MIDISEIRKDFYVYEWFNTNTGEVFYVGKGTKGRWKNTKGRNQYFINYYNKYNCDVRRVKNKLSEKDAFSLEVETIDKYKQIGQCKCNLTDGGEGSAFEVGSWNFYYQKLVALYNSEYSSLELMPKANDYFYKDLKNKSIEQLRVMYENYLNFNKDLDSDLFDVSNWEDAYEMNQIYSGENKPLREQSTAELVSMYESIPNETRSYVSAICDSDQRFKDFLKCTAFLDYMSIDTEIIDEIINLTMSSMEYMESFLESLLGALWHIRRLSKSKKHTKYLSFIPNIKTFDLIGGGDTIQVRFGLTDKPKHITTHIDIKNLILGLVTSEDKTLLDLIVEEMLVSPIVL